MIKGRDRALFIGRRPEGFGRARFSHTTREARPSRPRLARDIICLRGASKPVLLLCTCLEAMAASDLYLQPPQLDFGNLHTSEKSDGPNSTSVPQPAE